jgi:hypothetical protein
VTATNADEGMDLRDALRGVDAREYIALLDAIRESPETMRRFITHLAQENPPVFTKYAKNITGGHPGINWIQVDDLIRKREHIQAIKLIREQAGIGLKEAKIMADDRRAKLGMAPPSYSGNTP